jgi:hypothetical protein
MERKMNMENYFEEENSYFRNVVRDALDDLKHNRQAYVFYIEQVEEVKKQFKGKIKVKEEEGIYYLTLEKKCVSI